MKRLILYMMVAFICTGCVKAWSPLEEGLQKPEPGYEIVFPEGWLKYDSTMSKRHPDPLEKGVMITRQGASLQRIRIGVMPLDVPFHNTKKTLNARMLPQEAAEAVADNYRMTEGIVQYELLENTPTDIDGHPGFKLLIDYKMDNNLWLRRTFCGTIAYGHFYFIYYHAPRRHYFEQDINTFEEMLASLKLSPLKAVK